MEYIPIITLDKIYIEPDNKKIFFLDCTRVSDKEDVISRKEMTIDEQIKLIEGCLSSKKVILLDDVVFSGNALRKIIERLKKKKIEVVGVVCSIATKQSYKYFNNILKYGIKCNFLLGDDVLDEICERDFYFGIAGSGIVVEENKKLYKAPYFLPFGDPNVRASIPKDKEIEFSVGCLERSISLWEEIDKLRQKRTTIGELPERIIRTKENEEVVKVLKKERSRL